jgi:hypothetical protein
MGRVDEEHVAVARRRGAQAGLQLGLEELGLRGCERICYV